MTCANSIDHTPQLKIDRRFSKGVGVLFACTAGKLISGTDNDVSAAGSGGNITTAQDGYNLRAERAVSELDVPQSLVTGFGVELPFSPGKAAGGALKSVAAILAGGWQLNGITSYRPGYPLRLTATMPGGGNRPDSTGSSAAIRTSRSRGETLNRWFDTSAFLLPPSFSLGNVGRTLPDVRGPSAFSCGSSTAISSTRRSSPCRTPLWKAARSAACRPLCGSPGWDRWRQGSSSKRPRPPSPRRPSAPEQAAAPRRRRPAFPAPVLESSTLDARMAPVAAAFPPPREGAEPPGRLCETEE